MGLFDFIFKRKDSAQELENILNKMYSNNSNNNAHISNDDKFDAISFNKMLKLISANEEDEQLINNFAEKLSKDKNIEDQLSELFKDFSIPEERIKYYKSIEELYNSFPLSKRVVNQYVSSICRTDPITNRILHIVENNKLHNMYEDKLEYIKNNIELILTYYDIEEALYTRIAPKTVLYGNAYIEILNKNKVLNLDNYIEEVNNNINSNNHKIEEAKLRLIDKTVKYLLENYNKLSEDDIDRNTRDLISYYVDTHIDIELSDNNDNSIYEFASKYSKINKHKILYENDNNNEVNNNDNKEENDITQLYKLITTDAFNDISLQYHDPKYVLPIYNDQKIFGYLVFAPQDNEQQNNDLLNYFNQLFNPSKTSDKNMKSLSSEAYSKLTNYLYSKIIKKIEDQLSNIETEDEKYKVILTYVHKYDKDIYHIIKDILVEKKISKIKVRFVPAHRMIMFTTDVQEWPYGQSVIEPLLFYSKLYMLSLLSNVINKISRAAVIRKWILDTGIVQQQSNLIQKLKREITSKVITVDSIGSLSTIPKILTDFKDIITIQKNGKPFLDFTVQQTGDPSIELQDLDFIKQELISLTKIPSVYLGFTDTIELREQLVTANIMWAETITQYQKQFENKILELIDKIFITIIESKYDTEQLNNILTNNFIKPSDIFDITLNKPVMLQIQYLDAVFASASNIIQLLVNTPEGQQKFDIIKFFKKFIPTIDWEEFEKSDTDYEEQRVETQLSGGNDEQQSQVPGF